MKVFVGSILYYPCFKYENHTLSQILNARPLPQTWLFKYLQNETSGPGEGGGILGLDGPRVPAAESRHASRAAGLPDG